MGSERLADLVKDLSRRIIEARDGSQPGRGKEEWTKMALIVPLLDGLGWDRGTDIDYENSPDDTEGRLDFILNCQPPIGIEAKALDAILPRDHEHLQIKKGLKQCKERGASYFIWTTGDCWQFFSLALENAPMYQVTLSSTHDESVEMDTIADQLRIIEKERFSANPEIFDEAIRANWKIKALPTAWELIRDKHTNEFLELVRKELPKALDIEDSEILKFFESLKPPEAVLANVKRKPKLPERGHKFPYEWEQLLDSDYPLYEGARKHFRSDYIRKFGRYLIGEQYKTWPKKMTWKYGGLRDDASEKKKAGTVIFFFKKWGFIEKAAGHDMYQRVEDGVSYLKKLLEKLESS